ncbi:MAG: hypothetical protein ABW096_06465 [Candidatus Thiodiazotropha sp.]
MHPWNTFLGLTLSLTLALILLSSCGGSGGSGEDGNPTTDLPNDGNTDLPNDGNTDIPDIVDPGDPPNQDPSVLKVSDLRTAAEPDAPITVFNSAGDGVSVWVVRDAGTWLYYSLYDSASDSWSRAERLTEVVHDNLSIEPKLVSNGTGYAVAWLLDSELHVSLFNNGEWTTTRANSDATLVGSYHLASNGIGYLLAWNQHTDGTYVLHSRLSDSGMTWRDAKIHSEVDGDSASSIQIASDGTGYALIWAEGDTRIHGVLFDGSTWQVSEVLVNLTGGATYNAHIASNGRGYSLVWSTYGPIRNRLYTASGGWSPSSLVFPLDSAMNFAYANDIVSNGTGYCVLFTTLEDSGRGLYAVIDSMGDSNWGEASRLNISEQDVWQKTLVSDGDGYAAAWGIYEPSVYGVNQHTASVYQGTGWNRLPNPVSIVPIDGLELIGDHPLDEQAIEIAGSNGHYVLAAKQLIDGVESISATRFDNNGGWGETLTLESGSGSAKDPKISAIPNGGITLFWHQINDAGTDISTYTNEWDGSQWSGMQPLSVANYPLGSSYAPQLVAAGNGHSLAVWSQVRNGYRALIAGIRDGDDWLQPVVLSDSITEAAPQLASNGTGFAVSWEERSGDGYLLKGVTFERDLWSESIVQDISLLHQSSETIPLALASNGSDYMLLYVEYNSRYRIGGSLLARHFDGAAWHEPATIAEGAYMESGKPQIATNGSSYLTAWLRWGDTMDLYASQYDGTGWSSNQLVAAELEIIFDVDLWQGSPDVPQLASDGEGYGIFWFDRGRVMSSLYTGSWSNPEELGDVNLFSWKNGETPSVASNGRGYAVAWRSDSDVSGSTLHANVYDGNTWVGAEQLNDGLDVMFDMFDNHDLLKASGDKYTLLWGTPYFSSVMASMFNGTQWSTTQLNQVQFDETTRFQLASDGVGFLAAWTADNGSGTYELFTSSYDSNAWEAPLVVDENSFNKYDLDLLGDANGFQAIWTRAEQGGDPWVRIPWSKSGL